MEATQHSLDWYRDRLGKFTGSQVGNLMTKGRKKDEIFGQTALSYINEVAGGRFMNEKIVEDDDMFQDYLDATSISSKAMQWGTEQEENARALYAKILGIEIEERGLVDHPTIPFFASSPDGYIAKDKKGKRGCIEIKCPKVATYMDYATKVHDNESLKATNAMYYYQCLSHIMCCDVDYTDFIVYCPFLKMPIKIVTIIPNEEDMKNMEERIMMANVQVENIIQKIDKV